jgi:hypothetical protein
VAQLVQALRYKPEGRGFNSQWCHWNFSFTWSFQPHHGLGVDSASNKNEYQEYFLGGKGNRCVALTLPPWCGNCFLHLGALTYLILRACPGIALPSSLWRKQNRVSVVSVSPSPKKASVYNIQSGLMICHGIHCATHNISTVTSWWLIHSLITSLGYML